MECFLFTGSALAVLVLGFISGVVLRSSKKEDTQDDIENYIWYTIIQRLNGVEEALNKRGICERCKEVSEWDRITDPAIKWDPKIEGQRSGDTWTEGS